MLHLAVHEARTEQTSTKRERLYRVRDEYEAASSRVSVVRRVRTTVPRVTALLLTYRWTSMNDFPLHAVQIKNGSKLTSQTPPSQNESNHRERDMYVLLSTTVNVQKNFYMHVLYFTRTQGGISTV